MSHHCQFDHDYLLFEKKHHKQNIVDVVVVEDIEIDVVVAAIHIDVVVVVVVVAMEIDVVVAATQIDVVVVDQIHNLKNISQHFQLHLLRYF